MIHHCLQTKFNHQYLTDMYQYIFTNYGTLEEISFDSGPQFIAHQFQKFLCQWGVQQGLS